MSRTKTNLVSTNWKFSLISILALKNKKVGVLEKHQSFKLDIKIVKDGTKLGNPGGRERKRERQTETEREVCMCVCVSWKSGKL